MMQIARAIHKGPATVFSYLRYHGGIRPRQRVRSSAQLSLDEREEVSRGLAANLSIRAIALLLDRSPTSESVDTSIAVGLVHMNLRLLLSMSKQVSIKVWELQCA